MHAVSYAVSFTEKLAQDAGRRATKMAGAKGLELEEIRKAVADLEERFSKFLIELEPPIQSVEQLAKRLKPRGVTAAASSEGLLR